MHLRGKTAVVTGSTRGLGREIAEVLASAGCNVVLNGFIDGEDAATIQRKLESTYGSESIYHEADLTKPREIDDLIATALNRFGAIDLLVNNAGMQFVSPLESFPGEKWDRII